MFFYGRINYRIFELNTYMGRRSTNMAEDTLLSDEELAKKKKRAAIIDKITTGILIFLMASPFLVIGYIFAWFLAR